MSQFKTMITWAIIGLAVSGTGAFATTVEPTSDKLNGYVSAAEVEAFNQKQLAMFEQLGETLSAKVDGQTHALIQTYELKVTVTLGKKEQGVNELLSASF